VFITDYDAALFCYIIASISISIAFTINVNINVAVNLIGFDVFAFKQIVFSFSFSSLKLADYN
jgi:hypothetical protein